MMDREAPRHDPRRPPAPGALTINLDRAVRARIDQQAAGEGVRPWELVTRWIIERLRDDAMGDDAMGDDRDEMWGEIDALRDRLATVEQRVGALSERTPTERPPRKSGQAPLHLAIARVLSEAGRPLSIGQITEAIREQGLFSGPRNGKPPTTSMISSRLAHSAYRAAFRRDGDQVSLAIPFERLTPGRALPTE